MESERECEDETEGDTIIREEWERGETLEREIRERRERKTRYTIKRKKRERVESKSGGMRKEWGRKRDKDREKEKKKDRKKELRLHLLFRIARRSGGTTGVEKIVQSWWCERAAVVKVIYRQTAIIKSEALYPFYLVVCRPLIRGFKRQ